MENVDLQKDGLLRSIILQEKVSAKSGRPYKVLIIRLVNDYEKVVFLEQAELKMVEMLAQSKSSGTKLT